MIVPETNNNEEEKELSPEAEQGLSPAGTTIQRFYAGQKILITGGTGFLGKILTEKLLRSCPDLVTIYLLVRAKKGKTVESRIQDVFEDRVYDRLREDLPRFREKIVAVNGDCGVEGLDLSEADRDLLTREVSIVFHAAATVRFDEKLKLATAINVRGTGGILEICKHMRKLKSFIHVSTAYANCHAKRIDECFYEYPIGHQYLLAMVDTLPEGAMEEVTARFVGRWPNTYAFTKALAEALIKEENGGLPIGIFRPAIVVSTAYEPLVGWIDNLYGPTGVVAAGASGILKTIHCDPDVLANIVPVDVTVNALIASAWDVHTQKERRDKNMLIYNYVSSVDAPLSWREFNQASLENVHLYPPGNCVWYFSFAIIKSRLQYLVTILFAHLLPALLLDAAGICLGRKPSLWKMYRKVHKFSNVLSHFCLNEWTFSNDNVGAMWLRLPEKDRQLFRFSMKGFDWANYFRDYVLGIRTYLFKEDPKTLPASRIRAARLYWLHQFVKCLFYIAAAWIAWIMWTSLIGLLPV